MSLIEGSALTFLVVFALVFLYLVAAKRWARNRHQDERYTDKHVFLKEILNHKKIMVAALESGAVNRAAWRRLLSDIGSMEEGRVDVILALLYSKGKVRRAISLYMKRAHGLSREQFETDMEGFSAKMFAARDRIRGVSKVS